MKTIKWHNPNMTYRFANEQDAIGFINSVAAGEPAYDLAVKPYTRKEAGFFVNDDWLNAPFELAVIRQIPDDAPVPENWKAL